jgi:hypothetical protein
MTKWTLFNALVTGNLHYKGQRYILCAIEREDGSGSSFNLKVIHGNSYTWFHVYTDD